MYLCGPYKQFSTTKVLPLQMVPISGLAQGLIGTNDFVDDQTHMQKLISISSGRGCTVVVVGAAT